MTSLPQPHSPEPPRRGGTTSDLSLGLQFGLTAILGLVVGYWLGKRWGMESWGLIAGLFLGAFLGTINLVRALK